MTTSLKQSAAIKLKALDNPEVKLVNLDPNEWDDWFANMRYSDDRYYILSSRSVIFKPTGQRITGA